MAGKVMVVDDDPLVLRITQARLEKKGYRVVARQSALGTTQAIMEQQPDVILLDLDMPAFQGDQLVTVLRQNAKTANIPIIFHSGKSLLEIQRRSKEAGAVGAIAKTGNDEAFVAQFERLFARAKKKSG